MYLIQTLLHMIALTYACILPSPHAVALKDSTRGGLGTIHRLGREVAYRMYVRYGEFAHILGPM